MDLPKERPKSAREDRALLNGVGMFRGASNFSVPLAHKTKVFARAPATGPGRTSPQQMGQQAHSEGPGIGSEDYQVPSSGSKSLEYWHFSSSILCLLSTIVAGVILF